MPNVIKYNISTETRALKKGDFWIGTGDVDKGPTSTTGYWNSIIPTAGGYTIYLNKASGGPSIYSAANDTQLISLSNAIAGQTFATAAAALAWFATQTDKVVFNSDYPAIITDGLVLNLDAGFAPSYPTSGTSWYDLSSNSNNVTLTNGPTFNSSSDGSIVFDGVDDYGLGATALNYNNSITIESWIYPTNYPSVNGGFILSNLGYYLEYGTNGKLKSYFYGLSSEGYHESTAAVPLNTWSCVNTTRNKDNNTIQFYINGVLDRTISNITGSISNGGGTGRPQVGGFTGSSYKFNGRLSSIRLYNRALTSSEILRNYNATKGRFGL
jgi:hypothetical protein